MDPHTDYKQVELAARRRRAVRRAVTYVLLALWAVNNVGEDAKDLMRHVSPGATISTT